MPAYGVEALRHKAELNEVRDRIGSLLRQLDPDDEEKSRTQPRVTKKMTRRASRLVEPEPALETEEFSMSAFQDVNEKLQELLGALNLEERRRLLSQVTDWFAGHTPLAQKDIAVLERADKECLRRECERAWAALGTEDRMRKKERNTIRQVQQFVEVVAEEHRSGVLAADQEEELVQFDQRLLGLRDDQLNLELEELRRKIRKKEKEVMVIMLNIAERGSFLNASSISQIREEMEKQDGTSLDLVAEQEKVWIIAEEELRRLEAQKDLIFETVGFVKGRMKGEDKVPLGDDMAHFLQKKRADVEAKHLPGLMAKRMEEHGKDLEAPSKENLLRMQEETEELNLRIQQAAALILKVSSDSQVIKDIEKNIEALQEGAEPNVEVLSQLAEIMNPQKDWNLDNVAMEDRKRAQMETDRLIKRKAELLTAINRMLEEQYAVQRDWAEQRKSLDASEAELHKKEQLVPGEEEALRFLQEQHDLIVTSLACARSNIPAASTLKPSISLPQARHPSRLVSAHWNARRMISEDDNESVGSSSSFPRQVSFGQKSNSSGASAQEGVPQRRSLVVEPADPVPTWCADAVVAEAIRELLSSNRPCAEWVDVFSEDSNGRIRKSALAAQSALLSQLDKEQENLQLEVQELERQVQERMLVASMKVPIDGQAEEKAKTAVQEMDRQIQALRTVQVPPSRDHAGQNDLHARLAGVQRCQEALKRGDHPDELPPVLRPVREALLLEKENQALMRQIVDLGPETEKFRANFATFKRSMERFNFRRRLSSQKRNELGDRNRNRALRQSCRELNVLREQVKRARAEAALD